MSWISAHDISISVGDRILVSGATFTINPGDRVGIVGPNGIGKTSLLRLLSRELDPHRGHLEFFGDHQLARLEQWQNTPPNSVWDAAYQANRRLIQLSQRISQLESQMSQPDAGPDTLAQWVNEWGELVESFTDLGGYEWDAIVKSGLRGIGFNPDRWDDAPRALSGGEAHRLALLQIILSGSDIWLLDEPTNHLDIITIEWVEQQLRQFSGAALIVSHDRAFLDHVCTRIMSWEDGFFWIVSGSYAQYLNLRRERLSQEALKYQRYLEEQSRLQDYINKWRAGTRARQAQSRAKALNKLNQSIPTQIISHRAPSLALSQEANVRGGSLPAITLNQLTLSQGSRTWSPLSLKIPYGARVALVGPNGAGKTTLLRGLMASPTIPQVKWRDDITVGYLPQSAVAMLPDDMTGIEYAYQMGMDREEIYYVGAQFGLPHALWETLLQGWSGGERSRLKLIETLMAPSQCLLLDEPTNHLDIPMREALEHLLIEYPGTLIIASHDRALLANVSTHTWWATGTSYVFESLPFREGRTQMLNTSSAHSPSLVRKRQEGVKRASP